eukprot:SAG31_NODE_12685_length_924_cov_1.470303_1_plen_196_part_00
MIAHRRIKHLIRSSNLIILTHPGAILIMLSAAMLTTSSATRFEPGPKQYTSGSSTSPSGSRNRPRKASVPASRRCPSSSFLDRQFAKIRQVRKKCIVSEINSGLPGQIRHLSTLLRTTDGCIVVLSKLRALLLSSPSCALLSKLRADFQAARAPRCSTPTARRCPRLPTLSSYISSGSGSWAVRRGGAAGRYRRI